MAAVARTFGLAVLLSYAQLLFSRSPFIGALFLLGTALSPRAAACGLLGAVAALLTARALDLEPEARADGTYGYNALLCGLMVGHGFSGSWPVVYVVLCAAPAAALLTAALRSALRGVALPVLSWPFLIVHALTLGLAGTPLLRTAPPAGWDPLFAILLLIALLCHSRIAVLLAVLGVGVCHLGARALGVAGTGVELAAGGNALFTAVALGGVWFVPAASSFLLAAAGAVVCTLLSAAAGAALAHFGLPVSSLPFNLTIWLVLLALRQRARDGSPKAVDFLPGTPEENLTYLRTRLLRFSRLQPFPLRLPVRGPWVCSQGVDGSYTHQGPWRHAYDLEVRGPDGCFFRGDGSAPEQYHAYRLPVLAAGPGVVARIVSHVPDNPIGDMNLSQNWGNLVLIKHAQGLYSLVAHLAPGSVRVAEGQTVQAGDVLGLCGSSGRSPQPHVHFHLQASERLGDPTLPCRFWDVVETATDGEGRVVAACSPEAGQEVRSLVPSPDAAAQLGLVPGAAWTYEGEAGEEEIRYEVDLYGRRCLYSPRLGATLYFDLSEDFLTIYDVVGGPRSVLHLLRAALPRVPLELDGGQVLRYRDHLPARPLRAWPLRLLGDFVAPFWHRDGVEVEYRMRRQGRRLIITGETTGGALRTEAEIVLGRGPVAVAVTLHGRRRACTIAGPRSEMQLTSELVEATS